MTTGIRSRAEAFIEYLTGLVGPNPAQPRERGALAELRRGAGKPPGEAAEGHRHVLRFAPRPGPEEEAFYLVGALFALHPRNWEAADGERGAPNLGASLAWLKRQRPEQEAGIERRLTALLASRREELPVRLRNAITLLRGEEIPVDWLRLLRDLRFWERDDRRVQLAWARAFWGTAAAEQRAGDGATSGDPDDNDGDSTRKDDDQ